MKNKSKCFVRLGILLLVSAAAISPTAAQIKNQNHGTLAHPIIDSRMSKKQAFDGLNPDCPAEIHRRQRIVKLKYYSFDNLIHQGNW